MTITTLNLVPLEPRIAPAVGGVWGDTNGMFELGSRTSGAEVWNQPLRGIAHELTHTVQQARADGVSVGEAVVDLIAPVAMNKGLR